MYGMLSNMLSDTSSFPNKSILTSTVACLLSSVPQPFAASWCTRYQAGAGDCDDECVWVYFHVHVDVHTHACAGAGGNQGWISDISSTALHILNYFLSMCIYVCLCWGMCICECGLLWNPEECIESAGAGVTGGYRPSHMVAGDQTQVLFKSREYS